MKCRNWYMTSFALIRNPNEITIVFCFIMICWYCCWTERAMSLYLFPQFFSLLLLFLLVPTFKQTIKIHKQISNYRIIFLSFEWLCDLIFRFIKRFHIWTPPNHGNGYMELRFRLMTMGWSAFQVNWGNHTRKWNLMNGDTNINRNRFLVGCEPVSLIIIKATQCPIFMTFDRMKMTYFCCFFLNLDWSLATVYIPNLKRKLTASSRQPDCDRKKTYNDFINVIIWFTYIFILSVRRNLGRFVFFSMFLFPKIAQFNQC